MADKKRCAEKLYDCIGGIRDDYIASAENYTKIKSFYPQKLLASLAACVVLLIMVTTFSDIFLKSNDSEVNDTALSLQGVLVNYEIEPVEKVDLFSNKKLIWYSDGEYREKVLTQTQYTCLTSYMQSGFENVKESREEECLVWICDGRGNVVTPYLKTSQGNVYVNLFSYRAEVEPSKAFTKYVEKILT